MSRGEAAREFIYNMLPGLLGKAPEVRLPQDAKEENKERQSMVADAGQAVIAKYRFRESDRTVERRDSEDSTCVEDEFFAVADGTSSKGGGGEASRLAIKIVREQVARGRRPDMSDAEREKLLREAIILAGAKVKQAGEDFPGIFNTTFSSFLASRTPQGREAITVGHVGDSAVYHYRAKDKVLVKLTRSSGLVDALVETGVVSGAFAEAVDQSVDEGKDVVSPSRQQVLQTTNAALENKSLRPDQRTRLEYLREKLIGASQQPVAELLFQQRHRSFNNLASGQERRQDEIQIRTVGVEDGDMVFAASDGLDDVLTKERMHQLIGQGLADGKTMQEISAVLAQEASRDTSKRQKGNLLKGSDGSREGDDVSIAGAIFSRVERPVVAAPVEDRVERDALADANDEAFRLAR